MDIVHVNETFDRCGQEKARKAALEAAKAGTPGSVHRVKYDSVSYSRTRNTVVRHERGPDGTNWGDKVVWRSAK